MAFLHAVPHYRWTGVIFCKSPATKARHRLRCVCRRAPSLMSYGQDRISPMFNEVLRPPMLFSTQYLVPQEHWPQGASRLANRAKRPHARPMSGSSAALHMVMRLNSRSTTNYSMSFFSILWHQLPHWILANSFIEYSKGFICSLTAGVFHHISRLEYLLLSHPVLKNTLEQWLC